MANIGLKTADGGFFSIFSDQEPGKRKVRLIPAREHQSSVQIDLFRGDSNDIAESEYIGSLLLEHIESTEEGTREIELVVAIDRNSDFQATAKDIGSGSYQSFSVNLNAVNDVGGFDIPDFSLDDDQIDQVVVDSSDQDTDPLSMDMDMEIPADDRLGRELEAGLEEDISEDAGLPDPPRFTANEDVVPYSDSYGQEDQAEEPVKPFKEVRRLHPVAIAIIVLIVLAALGLIGFGIYLLVRGESTSALKTVRQIKIAWDSTIG
ncbi:MAG: Hsp70 family protein [Spirochaeta sp.]